MALARVVSFDGVTDERVEELRRRIANEPQPENLPASEILLLHDPDAGSAMAILIFDNEDDYRAGDAALNAMPAPASSGTIPAANMTAPARCWSATVKPS